MKTDEETTKEEIAVLEGMMLVGERMHPLVEYTVRGLLEEGARITKIVPDPDDRSAVTVHATITPRYIVTRLMLK